MNERPQSKYITLDRFLVEQQRNYPEATGKFTRFMGQIGTVAKIISNHMSRAALDGLLGTTGEENVQGEQIKQLDELGNRVFVEAFEYVDIVGMLVSEEMSEARAFREHDLRGGYAIMVDPVDGSSNIDTNGIIGSIFSIHDIEGSLEDSLKQRGSEQVAAGYIMYGPSTTLVYTAKDGVHSFVLDHQIGEFVLVDPDIKMPERGDIFSANLGRYNFWNAPAKRFSDHFMALENGPYSLRYSGALLADLHRILYEGGVYYYPEDDEKPDGKLRLLYECAPLALIAEEAGGAATSGKERILDIDPEEIHQRVPLIIGSQHEVALYRDLSQKQTA